MMVMPALHAIGTALAVLALTVAACGGEGEEPAVPAPTPPPASGGADLCLAGVPVDDPGRRDPPALERLRGLPEDEAAAAVRAAGCEWRVVMLDGEDLVITQDLRADRVNAAVSGGRVVGAAYDEAMGRHRDTWRRRS
jgi:LmbE family N-acetylglucosaminyl deacetylase